MQHSPAELAAISPFCEESYHKSSGSFSFSMIYTARTSTRDKGLLSQCLDSLWDECQ